MFSTSLAPIQQSCTDVALPRRTNANCIYKENHSRRTLAHSDDIPTQSHPLAGCIRSFGSIIGIVVVEARIGLNAVLVKVDIEAEGASTAWIEVTVDNGFGMCANCANVGVAWLVAVALRQCRLDCVGSLRCRVGCRT